MGGVAALGEWGGRTWPRCEGTPHGELDGEDCVCVAVADSVASAIECADVISCDCCAGEVWL